jgi:hypothetical protein
LPSARPNRTPQQKNWPMMAHVTAGAPLCDRKVAPLSDPFVNLDAHLVTPAHRIARHERIDPPVRIAACAAHQWHNPGTGRRSCGAHSIKHLPRSLLCFCRFGGCIQVPVARLRLLSDDEKAELVATVRASEAAASAGRKKRKGGAAGYVSALPSHAQCRRDVSRCTSRGK